ncbi:hypothetical protein V8F06_002627 [Rhypophila decipiens]
MACPSPSHKERNGQVKENSEGAGNRSEAAEMKGLACKTNDGDGEKKNDQRTTRPNCPSHICLTALVSVAGGNLFLGVMHSEYIYSFIQDLVAALTYTYIVGRPLTAAQWNTYVRGF